MGIFINGVDVSKPPFSFGKVVWSGHLGDLFGRLDGLVDSGSNRANLTDADFKVWSITGGLPVVPGKGRCEATDDRRFQDDVTKEVKALFPEATVMNLTVPEVEAYLDTGRLPVESGRGLVGDSVNATDDEYEECIDE